VKAGKNYQLDTVARPQNNHRNRSSPIQRSRKHPATCVRRPVVRCAKLLVQRGATLHCRDRNGETSLVIARAAGNLSVANSPNNVFGSSVSRGSVARSKASIRSNHRNEHIRRAYITVELEPYPRICRFTCSFKVASLRFSTLG